MLVDEYQDTNRLQALDPARAEAGRCGADRRRRRRPVDLLVPGGRGPQHPRLPRRSSRRRRDVVTLEQNYRSTQPILDASNAVIALAAERFTKNLWSDRPVGSSARSWSPCATKPSRPATSSSASWSTARRASALKAQAVLFRASHHSAALEIELTRRNIPFVKFGGLKFLEAAHVKDVLALLRLAENPRDRVAGFRVLQLLPGIGPATAATVARRDGAEPIALRGAARLPAAAAARRRTGRPSSTLCCDLRVGAAGWPAELELARALVRAASRAHSTRCADPRGPTSRSWSRSPRAIRSRERFLTELTLDPPDATSDQAGAPLLDEDYLILSTIHSAKGQEWKSVFVLNVVDGCIPSDMATGTPAEIEEERRLLYVAMTRAKDDLHLIMPQRFLRHQQPRTATGTSIARAPASSRAGILDRFTCSAWPVAQCQDRSTTRSRITAPIDLKTRMRGMWG